MKGISTFVPISINLCPDAPNVPRNTRWDHFGSIPGPFRVHACSQGRFPGTYFAWAILSILWQEGCPADVPAPKDDFLVWVILGSNKNRGRASAPPLLGRKKWKNMFATMLANIKIYFYSFSKALTRLYPHAPSFLDPTGASPFKKSLYIFARVS